MSWAKFFHIPAVDAKRSKKLVNNVLHFFCTLSTRRNTVHFNYVPSVLELELCTGWKCTWCFSCNEFWIYIFICVHFKAFCYIEAIKSCSGPFLSNWYCTSVKRPTSIKRPLLKVPRVAYIKFLSVLLKCFRDLHFCNLDSIIFHYTQHRSSPNPIYNN